MNIEEAGTVTSGSRRREESYMCEFPNVYIRNLEEIYTFTY